MRREEPESGGSRVRRSATANYASQVYGAVVTVATVPYLLAAMRPEAYGLVGFFSLLQGWSQVLDLGLSAAVIRESARFAVGSIETNVFRGLLRAFGAIFWTLGAGLAVALVLLAPVIARSWLRVQQLPMAEVREALMWMAASVALRWIAGLYRGVVLGTEHQVWLSAFGAIMTTVRFVAVLPVMAVFGATARVFFLFQTLASALELTALMVKARRLVPTQSGPPVAPSRGTLTRVLRFSAQVAFATIIWVTVTQVDKAVISAKVPLAEYGFFTVAITGASAISLFGEALVQALMPRLTRTAEIRDEAQLRATYRRATQLLVVVALPLTLSIATLAQPVLWAWTGDAALSKSYAPILALYAVGNGFMSLVALSYVLQYARGDLRLHVYGNIVFAIVLVPTVIYTTSSFGAIGAAWTWAVSNALLFLFWVPLVHSRMAPGLHAAWMREDVARSALPVLVLGVAMSATLPWNTGRAVAALRVALCTALTGAAALLMSDWGRLHIVAPLRRAGAPGLWAKLITRRRTDGR